MYRATGLPGWVRFGFSPGWAGRGGRSLGPCAQYLITGQWPVPAMDADAPTTGPAVGAANRIEFLEAQAAMLQAQLESLRGQIEALTRDA